MLLIINRIAFNLPNNYQITSLSLYNSRKNNLILLTHFNFQHFW